MKEHFYHLGMEIGGVLQLTPKEAFEASQKGALIVDIRQDFETAGKKVDVKEVVYMPYKTFAESCSMLQKSDKIILLCAVGMRGKSAALLLLGKGYPMVANINGGIMDWEKDGLPMDINKGEMLTGSCLCQLRPKKRFDNAKE